MDHLTFAQLLGNYGEFVGAIAVVATLAYLAVQIRQNSQMLATDMISRSFELALHSHIATMGENPMRAAALAATNPDELTDEELLVLTRTIWFWIDFDSKMELNVANGLMTREFADKYLKIHAKYLYGHNPVSALAWHELKHDLGGDARWINIVDNELSNFDNDTDAMLVKKLRNLIEERHLAD